MIRYTGIRAFYVTTVSIVLNNIPLNYELFIKRPGILDLPVRYQNQNQNQNNLYSTHVVVQTKYDRTV